MMIGTTITNKHEVATTRLVANLTSLWYWSAKIGKTANDGVAAWMIRVLENIDAMLTWSPWAPA